MPRLFYAILLPEDILDALCAAQDALRERAVQGNFSRRENLHLTLAFLGETENLAGARRGAERLPGGPFPLRLQGAGSFRQNGGRLFWAGVRQSRPLQSLQEKLAQNLRAEGFRLEERPFRPHLTLARQVDVLPEFDPKAFAASIPALEMRVQAVSLMQSQRIRGVLTYREIYRKSLGE